MGNQNIIMFNGEVILMSTVPTMYVHANLPYPTPDFNDILCLPTLSSGPDEIPYYSNANLPGHNDNCHI